MRHKVVGVIPARFASTRFPGKPLAAILNKSLIQRTYENAKKATCLDKLVVATDHQGIFDHVREFGGDVVMTAADLPTGTDRLASLIRNNPEYDSDLIVNIQGDEPCLDPHIIEETVKALAQDKEAVMSTACSKISRGPEAESRSIVKCVVDQSNRALYFSRSLIPFGGASFLRHIGLYVYRKDFLLHYAELPSTPLQKAEDLEQLKVLENGYIIRVALVEGVSIGVDVPEDIQKVEEILCRQNMSL
jgi:3-deoxy-manno-octulosonate cytidylyltransferase (CMP-KDO synthetase)